MSNAGDDPTGARSDDVALRLVDTARRVSNDWLWGMVQRVAGPADIDLRSAARDGDEHAARVVDALGPVIVDTERRLDVALSQLLVVDVAEHTTNPLALFRAAADTISIALAELGYRPIERDRFVSERFPHDHFELAPATWADIDPELAAVGLEWGLWKAQQFRRRATPDAQR